MKGFISNYNYWTNHDEPRPLFPPMVLINSYYGSSNFRACFDDREQMVMDTAGPSIDNYIE